MILNYGIISLSYHITGIGKVMQFHSSFIVMLLLA